MQALAKRAVEEFGRIDILINNAGILRDKSFAKMEMADFRAVVDVHLIGSANASRAVWDVMKGQNYGRILMTTSTSGVYGNFGQSNYGAAKAGLVGLMNVLHFEGDKYDIHVNAIAPTAATRMTGDVLDEEMLVRLAPENVVPAALFLVSEQAPSRTVLLAGAGTVARMAIVESEGVYLPKGERTPEAVAAAFTKIDDMTNFIETDAGLAHVDRIIATSRANEVVK
jgi:NAD(P)-dependent dehydrogenase (short-subunit alcohol dehydrogenase family)